MVILLGKHPIDLGTVIECHRVKVVSPPRKETHKFRRDVLPRCTAGMTNSCPTFYQSYCPYGRKCSIALSAKVYIKSFLECRSTVSPRPSRFINHSYCLDVSGFSTTHVGRPPMLRTKPEGPSRRLATPSLSSSAGDTTGETRSAEPTLRTFASRRATAL